MKTRGREGILHPKVVQISVNTKKAELCPSGISEPELRGERSSLREENRHGERKARQHGVDSVPAPSLPICGEARRYMHARGAGSLQPRERSLAVIVGSAIREAREPIRQGGEAWLYGSPKESREERGLLL
jgi:hypothetical protein